MRVAIFGIKSLPAVAGADRVVERLLEHASPEHEYTVYLLRDDQPAPPCPRNRRYVYIPALRGKHLRAFSYFFLCSIHFLFRGRQRVAHVHNSDFGLLCPLVKLKRGVRIVGTFHGDPYKRNKWGRGTKAFLRISEWCFVRCSDVLTSVSASKAVPRHTVHYIPNGVDEWTPSAEESGVTYKKLGLQKGQYLMFACGRLDATKGLHHLLRAYRELPEAGPLLVVGDFSHDRRYAKTIDEELATSPPVVVYRQLLSREALFDLVQNARIFVFPSEVEAMSMMLLEAIACRKVVVCSDIPENVAVVGNDYPFLFHTKDAASLRSFLQKALDATAAGLDVKPVYDEIVAAHRWDTIAARYEQFYLSR